MMERKSNNYALFIGTLSILGVMAFSPHLVFAQEDVSRPAILPDNIFYGLKLAIENLQEAFTLQDERKAELLLKHSEERDREAEELERQGKMIPLERLKEIQAEKLRNAEVIIQRLERAQNIVEQREQMAEERRELAQAQTDEDRIAIQMQQRARELAEDRVLIEPKIGMGLIEPFTERLAERPVVILPVDDITDEDDQAIIVDKLRTRLENSFSSSQITEIRAKFIAIQEESDIERKKILADQLDDKVNNPLVSITCFGRVDTFSLSVAPDPVKDFQEQCPILRTIPTEELRRVANDIGQ